MKKEKGKGRMVVTHPSIANKYCLDTDSTGMLAYMQFLPCSNIGRYGTVLGRNN